MHLHHRPAGRLRRPPLATSLRSYARAKGGHVIFDIGSNGLLRSYARARKVGQVGQTAAAVGCPTSAPPPFRRGGALPSPGNFPPHAAGRHDRPPPRMCRRPSGEAPWAAASAKPFPPNRGHHHVIRQSPYPPRDAAPCERLPDSRATRLKEKRRHEHIVECIAVAAAAATPLMASGARTDDPIFDLIAAHRTAIRALSAAFRRESDLEETIPEDQRTWACKFDGAPPPSDHPEWIAAEISLQDADDREAEAFIAVLTIPPTTLGGAAALLEHLSLQEFPEESGIGQSIFKGAFQYTRDDVIGAATVFLQRLASALHTINRPTA